MSENRLTFEEAYESLEKIANKLNSGDVSLDEALKLYEEGVKLSSLCTKTLEEAENRNTNKR